MCLSGWRLGVARVVKLLISEVPIMMATRGVSVSYGITDPAAALREWPPFGPFSVCDRQQRVRGYRASTPGHRGQSTTTTRRRWFSSENGLPIRIPQRIEPINYYWRDADMAHQGSTRCSITWLKMRPQSTVILLLATPPIMLLN